MPVRPTADLAPPKLRGCGEMRPHQSLQSVGQDEVASVLSYIIGGPSGSMPSPSSMVTQPGNGLDKKYYLQPLISKVRSLNS